MCQMDAIEALAVLARARQGDDAAAEDYRAALRINPTLQARISR